MKEKHSAKTSKELLKVLEVFLENYVENVQTGDWGYWDPEVQDDVIACRKVISEIRGEE